MKSVKVIRKFLIKNDFTYLRTGKHEIWKHTITGARIGVGTTPRNPEQQIKTIKYKLKNLQRQDYQYSI